MLMVRGAGIQAREDEEHDTDKGLFLNSTVAISDTVMKHLWSRLDVLWHSALPQIYLFNTRVT